MNLAVNRARMDEFWCWKMDDDSEKVIISPLSLKVLNLDGARRGRIFLFLRIISPDSCHTKPVTKKVFLGGSENV